jgi:tetratricopeptide (TPR) repeat protein
MIDLINKLDDYVDGPQQHLDGNVAETIENLTTSGKEYYLRNLFGEAVNDTELLKLRKNLNEISAGMKTHRSPVSFIQRNKWYLAAASISVAIVSSALSLLMFKGTVSKPEIFRDYYQRAKPFMIQRSVSQLETDYFSQAMKFYNERKYDKSAEILLANQLNAASKFYAAISLMELGDYKKAEPILSAVAADDTNLFVDQAEWYLGLCFLMNDKFDLAIKQFEKIASTQNYYNDKAAEIIKKID